MDDLVRGSGEWDMKVLWLDHDQLQPNRDNPNQQDDATFNALVSSIETEGWTQPVQAVKVGEFWEIVAGEHRWRAARVLDCKVPVIELPADDFDQDRRDWNLVKDNILRGSLNPEKFARLYDRMAQKYDAEVLQSLMGFTSTDAFSKVYKEVRDALPDALKDALDAAKDEIKTIDGLAAVLNRLFTEFGETLPSNIMTFSWGTKDVLWIQCDSELWKTVKAIADDVSESGESMTDRMKQLLHSR
jgi:ParB/RepB/Spo0J family partition protein